MMKNNITLLLILGFVVAASLPSCYYDNEETLYGSNSCDTITMSYANDIVPILSRECYACHDNAGVSASGYLMDTHETILEYVTSGSLIGRINDASNPMPPGQLMDECNRLKTKAWIDAGAPNN